MLTMIAMLAALSSLPTAQTEQASGTTVYLSEHEDLLLYSLQGWGELGINECAHQPGQKGQPIQIADKTYPKGIGHHATGEIIIDLDGRYDNFAAEVGAQTLPDKAGSVVFKVFVDDQLKFESGIMRTGEPAKPVSVPLAGAGELRLQVTGAGDGIACDCANWADARLTESASPKPASVHRLDVAPFARVVTSDPSRMNGCKAARTEEYRAEDVYLETDLKPGSSGAYSVPFTNNGPGPIGLRWLERRPLRELGVEFAEAGAPASTEGVQIQYWAGESAWQGEWKPLKASIKANGRVWLAPISWRDNPALAQGTRRIRWVLPASAKNAVVKKLTAISPTTLDEVSLQVECDPKVLGDSAATPAPAEIAIYNGELVTPAPRGNIPTLHWNYRSGDPLVVTLRYTKPRLSKSDRTVLQFRLPASGSFGVAVDDVLAQSQVFVKTLGTYVTRSPATANLEQYRRQIADRKTVLEEVRGMPDQTLAQATERLHRSFQNTQPTMLSLACDNCKFIAHRGGTIHFPADLAHPEEMSFWPTVKNLGVLDPRFGDKQSGCQERHLDGGWTPIPVSEFRENGLTYRERVYVVPLEALPLPEPGWLSPHPLCVAEFTIENTKSEPATATLGFTYDFPDRKSAPTLRAEGSRVLAVDGNRLTGCTDLADAPNLKPEINGSKLVLTGNLPAGKTATVIVYLPGWVLAPQNHAQLTGGVKLADTCKAYWEHVLAPAAKISIPDPLLTNIIKASQVHCLIAARSEAEGQRVAPWISSTLYGPLESEAQSIVRGMDFLGHHEFARRAHDYYVHRYNPAGYLSTGYTVMGTGWQVWCLGEHYQLTHDTAWLKKVAPDVARVCKWIMAQREKTKQTGPDGTKQPEYGLMPPGVMADWNAYAFHFCLNAYYYAALQAAASALADIDHPDTKAWLQNAAEFKDDMVRAYRWTQARMPAFVLRDGTAVPGCPSQVHSPGPVVDFFPGEDVDRSWCYDVELGAHHLAPLGVLNANSRDVTWIMDYYEDTEFLAEGWGDYPSAQNHKDWYNFGGFSKVQPYYCRNCEIYAMRDDVKPFIRSYFNTIPTLLNTENLSFEEHFGRRGAWNKTHETGYFLHQTRLMLVMEKEKELWLAPFVTCNWMKDGNTVGIENAPTRFGPVSYRITSHVADGRIEATIEPPTRNAPEAIVLRLRHPEGKPIKTVTVNGAEHRNFEPGKEIIRIAPGKGPITVIAGY